MRLIALRNFLNVHKAIKLPKDQNPISEGFIHKGAIFEIGGDAKYKDLMPNDQQFVAQLNLSNCIGDANDPKIVEAVMGELVVLAPHRDVMGDAAAPIMPSATQKSKRLSAE